MTYYGLHTRQGVFVLKLQHTGSQHGYMVHKVMFGTLDDQEIFKFEYFLDRPDGFQPEGKGVAMALFNYLFGPGSHVHQIAQQMTNEQLYIRNIVDMVELRFALLSTVGYPMEEIT